MKYLFHKIVDNIFSENIAANIDSFMALNNDGMQELITFLEYHRLDLFFWDKIKCEKIGDFLSKEQIASFEEKENKYRFRHINQLEAAKEIAVLFKKNNLDFVFLKGLPLSLTKYKNGWCRYCSDIDILMSKKNAKEGAKILIENGYQYGFLSRGDGYDKSETSYFIKRASKEEIYFKEIYTHELCNLVKKNHNGSFSNIDINFEFSWQGISPNRDKNLPFEVVKNMKTNLLLDNVKIPIFEDTVQFLHLCCHLYNEAVYFALNTNYNGEDPKELLLVRVFDLLRFNIFDLDKELLLALAERFNLLDKLKFSLCILYKIYNKDISPLYDPQKLDYNELSAYYSKRKIKHTWPIDLETRIYDLERKRKSCQVLRWR